MAAILLLAGSLAPNAPGEVEPKRFEYQQILMGVPVRILVYSADERVANAGVHAAFDRIRQLNLIFSDYDDESEISRLCRAARPGYPTQVSPDLAAVLADALALSRRSEGAFDVTVGPLVQLWRKARRTKQMPTAEALAAAQKRVGYRSIRLDPQRHTVDLMKHNMRLDFGGIVKGYAADAARDVLASHGLKRALVALSGDISAGDPPPGQPGWRIDIPAMEKDQSSRAESIWLCNKAVSTSGDAYQFVEIGGKRYAHLVDPKTGLGITRRISVTVIASRGMTADGLDSAIAILGREQGLKLLEETPGVSGRIIEQTQAGSNMVQTAAFAKYLAIRADGSKKSGS